MGQQFDSILSRPSDEDLLNACLVVAHRRFRDQNSALPFATSGLCVDHASRQNFRSSKKVFLVNAIHICDPSGAQGRGPFRISH
jgi:hypothetical protein